MLPRHQAAGAAKNSGHDSSVAAGRYCRANGVHARQEQPCTKSYQYKIRPDKFAGVNIGNQEKGNPGNQEAVRVTRGPIFVAIAGVK